MGSFKHRGLHIAIHCTKRENRRCLESWSNIAQKATKCSINCYNTGISFTEGHTHDGLLEIADSIPKTNFAGTIYDMITDL